MPRVGYQDGSVDQIEQFGILLSVVCENIPRYMALRFTCIIAGILHDSEMYFQSVPECSISSQCNIRMMNLNGQSWICILKSRSYHRCKTSACCTGGKKTGSSILSFLGWLATSWPFLCLL
ncbi:uncharacterized protein [Spinacia oleracea]|uniref:Uncharacterized protein n=1 Tax=Spinacia oleracea TaxID=3562 RepID=A0ABM3R114_SPIOL|nr:uncharacterized protein LOC130463962 [Spinacia oleracea]